MSRLRAVVAAVALPTAVVLASIAGLPGIAGAQDDAPTTTVPVEVAPGLGEIIGSPDPGPKPTDAGDRGGAAQLVLAGMLIAAVTFILLKIFREVNGSQSDASDPV